MFMRKVLDAKLPSKLETSLLDKHFGGVLSSLRTFRGQISVQGTQSGSGGQVLCPRS